MRANIPRPKASPAVHELTGDYLRAMQEISARLMDVLPDGQELWETLGQAEALLLEAQMTATPLHDVFPNGGVAAFCQSIIDEYRRDASDEPRSKSTAVPASKDKNATSKHRKEAPKGGIGAMRYRRTTRALAVVAAILVAVALVWNSGFFRFLTQGSAFYHEELYNFENTVMETRGESLTFEVPLRQLEGLSTVIYTDGEGYTITLDSIGCRERMVAEKGENGKTVYRKMNSWYIVLLYTVDAGFLSVRSVTPTPEGISRITLADGTHREGVLTADSSGPLSRGFEYARITFAELPANTPLEGVTATVTMEPPVYRLWERIGMGKR